LDDARDGADKGIRITLKEAEELNIYQQILNSQNENGWSVLYSVIVNNKEDVAYFFAGFGMRSKYFN
jgi:hypothetical protein